MPGLMRHPLIAGNWKMNGARASAAGELQKLHDLLSAEGGPEVLVCPPATLISLAADHAGAVFMVGGQDCHPKSSGAHTGDLGAAMLAEAGATWVIVGHSERRADHGETSELVAAKAAAGHAAGLKVIVCVGETLTQRDAGQTEDVVLGQVRASLPSGATAGNTVIAYEPVWAIGSGRTPTLDQVADIHGAIRRTVGPDIRILYGGSVKPDNAQALMGVPDVDGALVGGASLKAADFWPIIQAKKPA